MVCKLVLVQLAITDGSGRYRPFEAGVADETVHCSGWSAGRAIYHLGESGDDINLVPPKGLKPPIVCAQINHKLRELNDVHI